MSFPIRSPWCPLSGPSKNAGKVPCEVNFWSLLLDPFWFKNPGKQSVSSTIRTPKNDLPGDLPGANSRSPKTNSKKKGKILCFGACSVTYLLFPPFLRDRKINLATKLDIFGEKRLAIKNGPWGGGQCALLHNCVGSERVCIIAPALITMSIIAAILGERA